MVALDLLDARDALERELRRVCDRIRSLPLRQLAGPRAAAVRATAGWLASAGQGVEERDRPGFPAWRTVPKLMDHAAGDQLAVTGQDLLAALRDLPPGTQVWTPGGRRTAEDLARDALTALRDLRRSL